MTETDEKSGRDDESSQQPIILTKLEDRLKQEFTRRVRGIEGVYRFQLSDSEEIVGGYFTDVVHDLKGKNGKKKAVKQYGDFLDGLFQKGYAGEEKGLHAEAREVTQLFLQNFPEVQKHLPLKYSGKWAQKGLDMFTEYIQEKEALAGESAGPAGGDADELRRQQESKFREVQDYFSSVNEESLQQFYAGAQGQFKRAWNAVIGMEVGAAVRNKWVRRGALAALVAGAVAGAGWYAHDRETSNNELSGKLQRSRSAVTRLSGANVDLTDQVSKLNEDYNRVAKAVNEKNVGQLKQEVCDYLSENNDKIVFYHESHNPALGQLFDGIVGGSCGRVPKNLPAGQTCDYDSARNAFVQLLEPVFKIGPQTGYVRFTTEGCLDIHL